MLKGSVNEISGHTPIYKMACPIHNGILKSFAWSRVKLYIHVYNFENWSFSSVFSE